MDWTKINYNTFLKRFKYEMKLILGTNLYLQTATNSCSDINRPVTSKGLSLILCAFLSYLTVRICPPSSSCRSDWSGWSSGELSSIRVVFQNDFCAILLQEGTEEVFILCMKRKSKIVKKIDGLQHGLLIAAKPILHLITDYFGTFKALRLYDLDI